VSTVTCHTEGCANGGIPIEIDLTWTDDEGQTHTMDCYCGVCGQQITDIGDG
jgi:hypothetical protein